MFVTLGHFLHTWSLWASLIPFDPFPLQSDFLALLSVCPNTPCDTSTLSMIISYTPKIPLPHPLSPGLSIYPIAYYMGTLNSGRPSSLCLQVGCPSFTVQGNMLPGEMCDPQGFHLLLHSSISLMPGPIIQPLDSLESVSSSPSPLLMF